MGKRGYCWTCRKTFTIEDRMVGKVITAGLATLATIFGWKQVRSNPYAMAGLGVGGVALGHYIDTQLELRCPTPGCTTLLQLLDELLE